MLFFWRGAHGSERTSARQRQQGFPSSCEPMVLGGGEPCHQHTAHPQPARSTILSCRNGAAHWLSAHPPLRAVRTALGHHFWTRFGVCWRLFGPRMTLNLTSHLCPICIGRRKADPGTSITVSKWLLKGPNDFGSQCEEWQDDQWKFSRTEEDNAVLNNTRFTLPSSTYL